MKQYKPNAKDFQKFLAIKFAVEYYCKDLPKDVQKSYINRVFKQLMTTGKAQLKTPLITIDYSY